MYKKTILIVPALLCLYLSSFAQTVQTEKPLFIDSNLPAVILHNVINSKDTVIKLSDIKNKLVILDFWNTYCSVCIEQFPKEDSLQKLYKNDVQFIMVTPDSKQKVIDLLSRWQRTHHTKLSIPIAVEDTVLSQDIRYLYQPHFAWIDYLHRLIAQTNEYFLNSQTISETLKAVKEQQAIIDAIQREGIKDSLQHLKK